MKTAFSCALSQHKLLHIYIYIYVYYVVLFKVILYLGDNGIV